MASYANQKDSFDTDSGLWTLSTTNGESVLGGGERSFAKTSGSFAMDQTGMSKSDSRVFAKGDGLIVSLRPNQDPDHDTLSAAYLRASTSLSWSNPVGIAFYEFGGSKIVLVGTSGLGADTNKVGWQVGEILQVRFDCDPDTGFLDIFIRGGGTWTDWEQCCVGAVDVTASGGAYPLSFQVNVGGQTNGISILDYQWYNADGPDPVDPVTGGKKCDTQDCLVSMGAMRARREEMQRRIAVPMARAA